MVTHDSDDFRKNRSHFHALLNYFLDVAWSIPFPLPFLKSGQSPLKRVAPLSGGCPWNSYNWLRYIISFNETVVSHQSPGSSGDSIAGKFLKLPGCGYLRSAWQSKALEIGPTELWWTHRWSHCYHQMSIPPDIIYVSTIVLLALSSVFRELNLWQSADCSIGYILKGVIYDETTLLKKCKVVLKRLYVYPETAPLLYMGSIGHIWLALKNRTPLIDYKQSNKTKRNTDNWKGFLM